MRHVNIVFVTLAAMLAIAAAPGAGAQDSAPVPPDQTAHVAELLDIFNQGCLHAYPAGSLAAYAANLKGEKLSREEFVRRVHIEEKTGDGWAVTGKSGNYVILSSEGYEDVARPVVAGMGNNETCTVIGTGPAGMPLLEPYRALKAQYAAEAGLTLSKATTIPMPARPGMAPGLMDLQFAKERFVAFAYAMVQRPGEDVEYRLDFKPAPAKAK
ncbi:MAG: hypothetical protein V4559_01275 [Pseudomonadota bacterium]